MLDYIFWLVRFLTDLLKERDEEMINIRIFRLRFSFETLFMLGKYYVEKTGSL